VGKWLKGRLFANFTGDVDAVLTNCRPASRGLFALIALFTPVFLAKTAATPPTDATHPRKEKFGKKRNLGLTYSYIGIYFGNGSSGNHN
jgi:hypothetical protein